MNKKEKKPTIRSYKLRLLFLSVLVILGIVFAYEKGVFSTSPKTSMNYTTTILDNYTRIDSTLYSSNNEISYFLTVGIPDETVYSESTSKELKANIINSIKKDKNFKHYIEEKVIFHYIYYNPHGYLLFKETITPDMYSN